MRPALGIPLPHDLVDELTGGLLGHAEVGGELGDGRTVRGEPREGEAVRGPEPLESTGDDTLMDALGELTGDGEQGGGQGHGLGVVHGGIETPLTNWSSSLTI